MPNTADLAATSKASKVDLLTPAGGMVIVPYYVNSWGERTTHRPRWYTERAAHRQQLLDDYIARQKANVPKARLPQPRTEAERVEIENLKRELEKQENH
jgi:hypothetical protein